MAVTKQFMGPTDFHSTKKNTVEVNGTINCLVINILQNIFFCAEEQLKGEYSKWQNFNFDVNFLLKRW